MLKRLPAICLAVLLPTFPASAIEPDAPDRLITTQEAVGIHARRLIEDGEGVAAKATKDAREALVSFYASRESRPVWIGGNGLNLAARAVIEELKQADDWGLDSAAFDLEATRLSGGATADELANAETAVSVAVLTYASHARGGRIPEPSKQLSSYLDRTPQLIEPRAVLDDIAKADDAAAYLRGLNPQHPQFLALRKALLEMRQAQSAETGEKVIRIPATGPYLRVGEKHADIVLLRKRLEVDVEAGADPLVYDAALDVALRDFQKQAGLSVDGVLGPNTRSTLNGGKARLTEETILANMEQWRWMPPELGEFYVQSNIPEYAVRVYSSGEVVHRESIIVGELDKQTPVFSDKMETVVFHPFWGVPNSIKVNEILPSVARGGNVLERQNLRMQYRGREVDPRSVDWSTADIRNFHVYQPPGSGNVLGVVKFLFPNRHQVYMHDTPTKHLFSERQRTFSHGCMRVKNPLKLAEAVMKYDRGWGSSDVQSAVDNGPQNNNVTLKRSVPVHVTYFTAVPDEDGGIKAVPDIYGHERRITLALAGRWNEIQKGRDHLAPVQIDRSRLVMKPQYSDPISDLFKQAFGF